MRALFTFILITAAFGFAAAAGAGRAAHSHRLAPVMEKPTKKSAALPGPAAFAIIVVGVAGVMRRAKN